MKEFNEDSWYLNKKFLYEAFVYSYFFIVNRSCAVQIYYFENGDKHITTQTVTNWVKIVKMVQKSIS